MGRLGFPLLGGAIRLRPLVEMWGHPTPLISTKQLPLLVDTWPK